METNIQKTIQLNKSTKRIIKREFLYLLVLLIIVIISELIVSKKIDDITQNRTDKNIEYITELRKQVEQNNDEKITLQEFAKRVRDKYPEYKDIEDSILVGRVIEKYPVYKSQIIFEEQKLNGADKNYLSDSQKEDELEKLSTSIKQLDTSIDRYEKIKLYLEYIIIGTIVLLGIRYLFYFIRWVIKNKLFNRVKLSYVLELMIPVFFTLLFSLFIGSKHYSKYSNTFGRTGSYVKYANELCWIFSLSFFLLTIAEWVRRHKTNKSEQFILKYLYIGLMLLVFILGIWFVKEFQSYE